MKAADLPVQRPAQAKLLVIDAHGNISHRRRADFPALLRPGDLVVANDASAGFALDWQTLAGSWRRAVISRTSSAIRY